MLKKLLMFLFLLLVLGGIGFAVWFFLIDGNVEDLLGPSFPKQAKGLSRPGQIVMHGNGMASLSAQSERDLLFLQGLLHAHHASGRLEALRDLFQGHPAADLPAELAELAPLFYYLDLHDLGERCRELYPPYLQVLLQSYADGLSAGMSKGQAWTVADVLMVHRGYAFLFGRNWVKDWGARNLASAFGVERAAGVFDYPVPTSAGDEMVFAAALEGLFRRPWIELVRMAGEGGVMAQQVRGHPYLRFLPLPTQLEIPERLYAEGLSLVGVPFLWSGRTETVNFVVQPVLADDEYFYQFDPASLLGREDLFIVNRDAPRRERYDEAPRYAWFGRRVTPLVSTGSGREVFYDWDGFRPSMDLAAFYHLLHAANVDEAVTAFQYHQMPAVTLSLGNAGGRWFHRRYLPEPPGRAWFPPAAQPRVFDRAHVEPSPPFRSVLGLDFSSSAEQDAWADLARGNGWRQASELDHQLTELLLFNLDGSLSNRLGTERTERAVTLLRGGQDANRAYFIQAIWDEARQVLGGQVFEEGASAFVAAMDLELSRLILEALQRRGGEGILAQAGVRGQNEFLFQVLRRALARLDKADDGGSFTYRDPTDKKLTSGRVWPAGVPAVTAPAVSAGGDRVIQVSFLTLVLADPLFMWRYPALAKSEMGPPQKVFFSPAEARTWTIQPAK